MKHLTKISTVLSALFVAAIFPAQATLNGDEENGNSSNKFTPIPMKTGRLMTTAAIEQTADDKMKNLYKQMAQEAQMKSQGAKVIFTFVHSFVVPGWIQTSLPLSVRSHLEPIDMSDIEFSVSDPLPITMNKVNLLLIHNRINLDSPETDKRTAFNILINGAEFSKDESYIARACNLELFALRLRDNQEVGIEQNLQDNMVSDLFSKAADTLISNKDSENKAIVADLLISAGQMKRWAAHRQADAKKKIDLISSSIALFHEAKSFTEYAEDGLEKNLKARDEQLKSVKNLESSLVLSGVKPELISFIMEKSLAAI